MKQTSIFGVIILFILFTIAVSMWLAPFYNQKEYSLLPYLSSAFGQCMLQKTEGLVHRLSKNGGYLSPHNGIANELTMEKEIETGLPELFSTCEELLAQEEIFKREITLIRAVVGQQEVSVYLDGFWKSKSGKIIPGFVIHVPIPLGESAFVARDIMRTFDETGMIRNLVLETLGKYTDHSLIRYAIAQQMKKIILNQDALFMVEPSSIMVDSAKREIAFPLYSIIKKKGYEFAFTYPVILTASDLLAGCALTETTPRVLQGHNVSEIIFDCGWYSCSIPLAKEIFLPKLCHQPVLFIDDTEISYTLERVIRYAR